MNWSSVLSREFVTVLGLLILFAFVMTNKKIGQGDKRLYLGVIATALIEMIAFEAERYTATFSKPTFLRVLLSVLGYILRPLLIFLLLFLLDSSFRTKKKAALLSIPLAVCILGVTTAFYSHICFWFDERNRFQRGDFGFLSQTVCIIYVLMAVYTVCKQIKRQNKLEVMISVFCSTLALCALAVDTYFDEVSMTRVAITLCTFIVYIQTQNKSLISMIDEIPGAIAKFSIKNGAIRLVSFNELLCHIFELDHNSFASVTKYDPFVVLDKESRQKAEDAMALLQTQDTASFQFKMSVKDGDKCFSVALKVTRRTDNELEVYATIIDVTNESRIVEELSMRSHEITLMMNQLGKIVCIYDIPTRTLSMSEQYAKLRGYRGNTAIVPDETNRRHLVSDEYLDRYNDFYRRIFAGEHSGDTIIKFFSPDGDERWEKTDFITITDDEGKPIRAIISIEDITKTYQEKLLLENYRSTLDSLIGDRKYCLLFDLSERKVLAYEGGLISSHISLENKSLEDITEQLISHYIKESDAEIIREFVNADQLLASYNAGILHRHIERIAIMPDRSERWFRLSVTLDSVNNKIMATLLCEDIDSEYRNQNVLIARANYDSLTGVLTRDATMGEIERYLSGEGRTGTHALVMMDMDNLKTVNDNLGHQFGDAALKDFASKIKQFFREDDIIGRIGGDEFFAFIKNITGSVLSKKIQSLLHSIESVYSDRDKNITVTASAGVSMYHGGRDNQKTLTELYSEADAALYKSKSLGKNAYTFSDELDVFDEFSPSTLINNDLISYSMKGVLDNLANGVAIFHGKIGQDDVTPLFCNEKLPALLDIDNKQFFDHFSKENNYGVHPDDLDNAMVVIHEAIETGRSIRRIFRIMKGNGDYLYLTIFLNVHCADDGSYDIYCIYSDAEEAEQLNLVRELRNRHFDQMLTQVAEKNESYVLLNITQDICIELHETHIANNKEKRFETAEEVLAGIANDIAMEEYRTEFLNRFSSDIFLTNVKDGIYSKEIRLPFYREGRGPEWYQMRSEASFDPNTGDVEVFATFENIDNEVRLEYALNRLLDDEYEYICQIDVQSGCMARLGDSDEDRISSEDNGKVNYDEMLVRGIANLLPVEHRENGLKAMTMEKIVSELKKQERYCVVFPVVGDIVREERLCRWSFEYLDASHSTILMCRKNISGILEYGYDSLTGLLGRKGFYRKIRNVLDGDTKGRFFIAELDIDNFSLVNEEKGYAEGNRFIRQFAADAQLKLNTKGDDCYIGHFEGDRFGILCSLDSVPKPEELFDDFVAQIETYPDIFKLNLRMGVYMIDDPFLDVELMCDCAHMALVDSKGRFDHKINYYSDNMKDRMYEEQVLSAEMQTAIDKEQFEVWFQPQINHANGGTLIGAEALVRWRHPVKGMISPALFIPLFEKNGFIYELDKYVWRHACAYLRKWIDEGLEPLPIAVNVSRLDILNPDFVDTVVSIIKEYNIPENLLHLEVTESAFTDNTGKVIDTVKELIRRGFVIAIDDFGSGYSSLSMLKSVPANILKLDMKFFVSEGNGTRNECIIESVIRMAKMLSMSVLAEGVERMEQADFLRTVGCDYIQGYLYSKPLTHTEYVEYSKHAVGEVIQREIMSNRESVGSELSKNQELYRSIVYGTDDIIIVADVHTKHMLYANRAAELHYGENFEPLKMMTCVKYCNMQNKCTDCPVEHLALGEKKEMIISENGNHMKAQFFRMDWNGHDAFAFIQTDVSLEMREKELAESLIRNIPGAIVTFSMNDDQTPKVDFISEKALQAFKGVGIYKDKYGYEDIISAIYKEDRERVRNALVSAFIAKRSYHDEFRVLMRNGWIRWIDFTVNPVAGNNDEYKFFGIYTDITDRKHIQEKADSIIQSIPSAMTIYAVNNEGMSRIFISDSAKKILDAEEDTHEVVSMDVVYGRIVDEDRERVRRITTECIKERKPFSIQFRIRTKNGTPRWVQLDATPNIRSNNECYFYSVYTDIDAEKRMTIGWEHASTQETVNRGLREALLKKTPTESIDFILGFVGQTIGSDRAYIFEKNPDGTDSNTYEWVAEGITPEIDNLQNVPNGEIDSWYEWFKEHGTLVIENIESLKQTYPKIYETLAPQKIKSLVVAPIYDSHGEPMGFFGMDNPVKDLLLHYPALAQTIAFFIEAMLKRRDLDKGM